MSSRLAYGMAREALLPRALGRILPGRRTPWVAIVVTAAASLSLALTGEVASLAETLVLLLLVVFAAVNTSVLILRREPDGAEHFRVPRVVPWLGLASCLFLFTRIDGVVWLRGCILIGVGLLFAAVNAVRAHRSEPDGDSTFSAGCGA